MKARITILIAALPLLTTTAQTPRKPPRQTIPPQTVRYDDSTFRSLAWRNIGPFRGGRANAVTGFPYDDKHYLVGYAGGGLWKTTDAGNSWFNISDEYFTTGSIGEIAVSPSSSSVIYVGTGEHAVRGVMTTHGDGVYKTMDGGETWEMTGLVNTGHISDIIVHPNTSDTVYVAAQGDVHGPSEHRGVYRSTNGGHTWERLLYIDETTGISSLAMDPADPNTLYAASWEHRRYPWTVKSGGPGSAIWKTTNAGKSWFKIMEGLPDSLGKIGISVSQANPLRLYAIVESTPERSGLYRSDDAGNSWELVNNDRNLCARPWYYMEVCTHPNNEDIVYVLNADLLRSTDGGKTFNKVSNHHSDTHDLWINPADGSNIILADDGGAEISFNAGETWSTQMNQPTAQFYRVNTDRAFPYKVYGGQQDNTSVIIQSRNNRPGITERDWNAGPGCESAYLAFDPDNPEKIYGGCYQGYIEVLDTRTGETRDIQAYPTLNLAHEPRLMKYRFNWNAPILTSRHDPATLYHGANVLLRSRDGGMRWEPVSGDLTRNEKQKQGPGGGPLTNEGAGGENYNTLACIAESRKTKGVIWTGSDCGRVHLTRDDGRTWQDVTPPTLPEALVHSIETSPHLEGRAYVCATRYKFNDRGSYTYRTDDFGKTWTNISNGIHQGDFLRVIREDPERPGLLYAGSERGFYVSSDTGSTWDRLRLNLPRVPVTDLSFADNDLVASTAGRAFWILDDVGPLRHHAQKPAGMPPPFGMVTPKPAYRYGGGNGLRPPPYDAAMGQNAPEGAILDYCLPNDLKAEDTLTLQILDRDGQVLRTWHSYADSTFKHYPGGPDKKSTLTGKQGYNRFLWNFRTEDIAPDVKDVYVYGEYHGWRVPPGDYTARLRLGSLVASAPVKVLPDPRIKATAEDWKAQQSFLKRVAGLISEMHAAVNVLREARRRIETVRTLLGKDTSAGRLLDAAERLDTGIEAWEKSMVESRIRNGQDVINWPSKLHVELFYLMYLADAAEPVISQGLQASLADREKEWQALRSRMQEIHREMDAFNRLFREAASSLLTYPK